MFQKSCWKYCCWSKKIPHENRTGFKVGADVFKLHIRQKDVCMYVLDKINSINTFVNVIGQSVGVRKYHTNVQNEVFLHLFALLESSLHFNYGRTVCGYFLYGVF